MLPKMTVIARCIVIHSFWFWLIAIICSIYLGLFGAYALFQIRIEEVWKWKRKLVKGDLKFEKDSNNNKWKKNQWRVLQFFLNSAGSMIGWFSLYYLLLILQQKEITQLQVSQLVALFVAFLGITGHLPYVAVMGRLPK